MTQSNNFKKENMEDWRNEHGQPNFEFLESLTGEGDPLNLEKLKSIADDLNVAYDNSTSSKDLVERIRLATQNGLNTVN